MIRTLSSLFPIYFNNLVPSLVYRILSFVIYSVLSSLISSSFKKGSFASETITAGDTYSLPLRIIFFGRKFHPYNVKISLKNIFILLTVMDAFVLKFMHCFVAVIYSGITYSSACLSASTIIDPAIATPFTGFMWAQSNLEPVKASESIYRTSSVLMALTDLHPEKAFSLIIVIPDKSTTSSGPRQNVFSSTMSSLSVFEFGFLRTSIFPDLKYLLPDVIFLTFGNVLFER